MVMPVNFQRPVYLLLLMLGSLRLNAQNKLLVFQSDFGLKDGAVAAMKGVANGVSTDLKLYDVTHEIPAYNIWEAAYRLEQTVPYWPEGTVFVSVVDPGVGTARKSVVLKTKAGHYIVTPDNGTLTLIARSEGIEALREIDEAVNRRKDSRQSYTFHGRDVYAYTGARLAAGVISFEEIGPALPDTVVSLPHQPAVLENGTLKGTIAILDVQYGTCGATYQQIFSSAWMQNLATCCRLPCFIKGNRYTRAPCLMPTPLEMCRKAGPWLT
jgi:hypothetical protein